MMMNATPSNSNSNTTTSQNTADTSKNIFRDKKLITNKFYFKIISCLGQNPNWGTSTSFTNRNVHSYRNGITYRSLHNVIGSAL